jgi:metallo-beta-lactamase class B
MGMRIGAAGAAAGLLCAASASAATMTLTVPVPAEDPVNLHLAEAQRQAGTDYAGLLARVCIVPPGGGDAAAGLRRAGGVNGLSAAVMAAPVVEQVTPPRADWYQQPRQVFDNLYWVGIKRNSSWLIRTSEGLIVIDTVYRYATEPSIVEGVRKLGFDPKDIKYVFISHGHGDHDEGSKVLQDLGARVVMSPQDWDLRLNGPPMPGGKPRRDIEGREGQTITLGDTSVTMYLTPGHTDGTLSFIFNVTDRGQKRVIAYPGGTAFNFPRTAARFQQYADSQRRLAKIAADSGATVLLTNHSEFDSAYLKARMLATQMPGEENPFVIRDGVARYFKVMEECSEAAKWRLIQGQDTPQVE